MGPHRRKKHSGPEARLTEEQSADLKSLADLSQEVDLAKLLDQVPDDDAILKQMQAQAEAFSPEAICKRLVEEEARTLAISRMLDPPIDDLLRTARAADPRTTYQLAKLMGVDTEILYRFENGKDIRLATAAKLAEVLNLTLTPKAQPKRPRLKRGRKLD